MLEYTIYTDGAYSSLRNQGGCGVVILKNEQVIKTFSKCYMQTTNNRMEILAVLNAVELFKNTTHSVNIYTDSMYVVGSLTLNWKRNANLDLWEKFNSYDLSKFNFLHVKGHNDNKYNEMCDDLAVLGSHLKILY